MKDSEKTWSMKMPPPSSKFISWVTTTKAVIYHRDSQAPCMEAFSIYSPVRIYTKLMSRGDTWSDWKFYMTEPTRQAPGELTGK